MPALVADTNDSVTLPLVAGAPPSVSLASTFATTGPGNAAGIGAAALSFTASMSVGGRGVMTGGSGSTATPDGPAPAGTNWLTTPVDGSIRASAFRRGIAA